MPEQSAIVCDENCVKNACGCSDAGIDGIKWLHFTQLRSHYRNLATDRNDILNTNRIQDCLCDRYIHVVWRSKFNEA